MKYLFTYKFWIIFTIGCTLNLWHAVYIFMITAKTDPYYEDMCFNVIIQGICLLLCIWSADKEKKSNDKEKKDEMA